MRKCYKIGLMTIASMAIMFSAHAKVVPINEYQNGIKDSKIKDRSVCNEVDLFYDKYQASKRFPNATPKAESVRQGKKSPITCWSFSCGTQFAFEKSACEAVGMTPSTKKDEVCKDATGTYVKTCGCPTDYASEKSKIANEGIATEMTVAKRDGSEYKCYYYGDDLSKYTCPTGQEKVAKTSVSGGDTWWTYGSNDKLAGITFFEYKGKASHKDNKVGVVCLEECRATTATNEFTKTIMCSSSKVEKKSKLFSCSVKYNTGCTSDGDCAGKTAGICENVETSSPFSYITSSGVIEKDATCVKVKSGSAGCKTGLVGSNLCLGQNESYDTTYFKGGSSTSGCAYISGCQAGYTQLQTSISTSVTGSYYANGIHNVDGEVATGGSYGLGCAKFASCANDGDAKGSCDLNHYYSKGHACHDTATFTYEKALFNNISGTECYKLTGCATNVKCDIMINLCAKENKEYDPSIPGCKDCEEKFDPETKTCITFEEYCAKESKVYNPQTGECEDCPSGKKFDASTNTCKSSGGSLPDTPSCPGGARLVGTSCQCPDKLVWNRFSCVCAECAGGYYNASTRTCQSTSSNQTLTPADGGSGSKCSSPNYMLQNGLFGSEIQEVINQGVQYR